MKAGELLGEHKKMKDKVKRLEKEVKHLEKHKNHHSVVSVSTKIVHFILSRNEPVVHPTPLYAWGIYDRCCHSENTSKQLHTKILLNIFHLNGHTLGFHPQT